MYALLTPEACGVLRCIDCTHIRVNQDGSNAEGGASAQTIGKTEGGLNTRLAVVVDGLGRAVGLNLASANKHDLRAIAPLVPTLAKCWVAGDRGFDSKTFREDLTKIGATTYISPGKSNRVQYYYSETFYAHRHVVENFFARIKRKRRVGARYEKLSETFLDFVTFSAIIDWLIFRFENTT